MQTAYRITAFSGGKEVWNTGKVKVGVMHCVYEGPVRSRMRVEWQVTLWDENDAECEPKETEVFDPKINQPASVLKKEFSAESVEDARIYATAHGIYALYLNGHRITDCILAPGTSEYWYRLPYQTYDVSKYLSVGINTIEVVLGDGWYRGSNGNTGTRNVFGTDIALLSQFEINCQPVLVTDETWMASQEGQLGFNDLQLGERIDARKVPKNFHKVKIENFGYQNLLCANTVPLKEKENFPAKLIWTPKGKKVLDFGQNMAGYVSFRLNAKAGSLSQVHN